MDRLEQIKNAVTANGMREWTDERVGQAMREYADQQNADPDTLLRDVLAWADELDISHVSVENIRTYLAGKEGAK